MTTYYICSEAVLKTKSWKERDYKGNKIIGELTVIHIADVQWSQKAKGEKERYYKQIKSQDLIQIDISYMFFVA